MNFFIKQHDILPDIKFSLTQKILNKYDITEEMMENVAVTFSMVDEDTELFIVANKSGGLTINDAHNYEKLDDTKYELFYCFEKKDTRKEGEYLGEFKLDFLGEHSGGITFPISTQIKIHIERGITITTVLSTAIADIFDFTFDYTFQ